MHLSGLIASKKTVVVVSNPVATVGHGVQGKRFRVETSVIGEMTVSCYSRLSRRHLKPCPAAHHICQSNLHFDY